MWRITRMRCVRLDRNPVHKSAPRFSCHNGEIRHQGTTESCGAFYVALLTDGTVERERLSKSSHWNTSGQDLANQRICCNAPSFCNLTPCKQVMGAKPPQPPSTGNR
jgi:hypothetical protein